MTNSTEIKNLSLYHYQSCPFCEMTRDAINELDIDIELRDIHLHSEHFEELIREGGKPQVPCLRIEQEDGKTHWLYESQHIIQLLGEYVNLVKNAA
ncbi:MAG: glutaredoxin [SAR86 cluster bacterium]|uniref:Glutaredoxin n=1 Tax=SAR86 cluster bacterium TaxID=2030880 RepID=A0A2A5B942_9GAMM|nr:MAG: glutaredoxin [SAR86 cluster bacterium]